jgi:hypothetical protein
MPKDSGNASKDISVKQSRLSSRTLARVLEQRYMFDAAGMATAADDHASQQNQDTLKTENAKPQDQGQDNGDKTQNNPDKTQNNLNQSTDDILSDINPSKIVPEKPKITDEKSAISYMNGLPLSFEKNIGQTNDAVKFSASGQAYSMYLTQEGIYFNLLGRDSNNTLGTSGISLKFVDGNSQNLIGIHELQGKNNYMKGADSSKWVTDIPLYEKIKYENVYQGIDAIIYGSNQNQIEYDFVVSPNADAGKIAMQIEGAESLKINAEGKLVIATKGGTLFQDKPYLYQYDGTEKHQIDGKFVLDGNKVKFDVSAYDPSKTLFIDPIFTYGTYFGEMGTQGQLIQGDTGLPGEGLTNVMGSLQRFGIKSKDNFLYIVGSTFRTESDSPAFPVKVGSFETNQNGDYDVFVAKLNPANGGASDRIYSTFVGGSSRDMASMLDVNAMGEVFFAGETWGTTSSSILFPTSDFAFDRSHNSGKDVFVAKLNASGNDLLYSTLLGGAGEDAAYHLVIDSFDKIYITGITSSSDFPTTSGVADTSHNGNGDIFVAKMDPSQNIPGNQLVYSTFYGGSFQEAGYGLTIDGSGNAYVVGKTTSRSISTASSIPFETTSGAFKTSKTIADEDGFLLKLNSTGGLLYSTFFGRNPNNNVNSDSDTLYSVALDSSGHVFVSGLTQSTGLATSAAYDQSLDGNQDAIIAKFQLNGTGRNDLMAATYFGGTRGENAREIIVNSNDEVWITGFTEGPNPVETKGTDSVTIGGNGTFGYFARFNNNLTDLQFSSHFGKDPILGNTTNNDISAVSTFTLDSNNRLSIIGTTNVGVTTTAGAFDTSFESGLVNIFIQSYSVSGTALPPDPNNLNLNDIEEDVPLDDNTGNLVSAIVIGSGAAVPGNPDLGIAVTDATNFNGIWQFSTNGGMIWNPIGPVSDANALLLALDNKIRFVPNSDFNGEDQPLTFKIWNMASGTPGNRETTLGSDFFSANSANALLDVTPVNDAPVLTVPGAQTTSVNTPKSITGILIADQDAGETNAPNNTVRVTLSVLHGSLHLTNSGLGVISGNDSNNVHITGNLFGVNTILGTLLYTPTNNYNGPDTLRIVGNDLGHTGATGPRTDQKAIDINVQSVNNRPTNPTNVDFFDISEDVPSAGNPGRMVSAIVADSGSTDPDSPSLGIAITDANNPNGIWEFSRDTGISWNPIGPVSDANALLLGPNDKIRFAPNPDFNGEDQPLTFRIWDMSNGMAGTRQSTNNSAFSLNPANALLDVTPVNDAPIVNVPGPLIASEDTPKAITGISITDKDVSETNAPNNVVSISLTVLHGSLHLTNAGLGNITGNDSNNVLITGNLFGVNTILETLLYTPTNNYNGPDTLTIVGNDLGHTGATGPLSDTKTMDINVQAVNNRPTNPTNVDFFDISEDVPSAGNPGRMVSAIVADSGSTDPDSPSLGIAITDANNPNGIWEFSRDTGISWNPIGPVSDANALLLGPNDKIRFAPNPDFNGEDQPLTFRIWDMSNGMAGTRQSTNNSAFSLNPANALLDVTPVNDAPIVNVPGPLIASEDTPKAITGISITDKDVSETNAPNNVVSISLTVLHGSLHLTNAGLGNITGNDSNNVLITGNLFGVNTILGTLLYTPTNNYNGPDTLTIVGNDLGHTGATGPLTDQKAIDINVVSVNNRPTNPTNVDFFDISEDVPSAGNPGRMVSAIVTDSGSTDPDSPSLGIAITDANNPNGIWEFSRDTGISWNPIGPVSDANALLLGPNDKIRFAPNPDFNGDDQPLTFRIWDMSNGMAGTRQSTNNSAFSLNPANALLDVTPVNDAPIVNVPGPLIASEDTPKAITGISITDKDVNETNAPNNVVSVSLTVLHGSLHLTNAGLGNITGNDSNNVLITGNLFGVNTILGTLLYTPTNNYNGPDTLTIVGNDLGHTGATGPLSDTKTMDINVQAVNDAPRIDAPDSYHGKVDTELPLNNVSISDADSNGKELLVKLQVKDGKIRLANVAGLTFIDGTSNGDPILCIQGTMDRINKALETMSYESNKGENDQLNINVDDLGNTGSGGPQRISKNIPLIYIEAPVLPALSPSEQNPDVPPLPLQAILKQSSVNGPEDLPDLGNVERFISEDNFAPGSILETTRLSSPSIIHNSIAPFQGEAYNELANFYKYEDPHKIDIFNDIYPFTHSDSFNIDHLLQQYEPNPDGSTNLLDQINKIEGKFNQSTLNLLLSVF